MRPREGALQPGKEGGRGGPRHFTLSEGWSAWTCGPFKWRGAYKVVDGRNLSRGRSRFQGPRPLPLDPAFPERVFIAEPTRDLVDLPLYTHFRWSRSLNLVDIEGQAKWFIWKTTATEIPLLNSGIPRIKSVISLLAFPKSRAGLTYYI